MKLYIGDVINKLYMYKLTSIIKYNIDNKLTLNI